MQPGSNTPPYDSFEDAEERDDNFVYHSGMLVEEPRIRRFKNNKESLMFTMRVNEDFTLADNNPGIHINFFTYEVLGRNAQFYATELKVGQRYIVTCYARAERIDGVDRVIFRCYNIQSAQVTRGRRRK